MGRLLLLPVVGVCAADADCAECGRVTGRASTRRSAATSLSWWPVALKELLAYAGLHAPAFVVARQRAKVGDAEGGRDSVAFLQTQKLASPPSPSERKQLHWAKTDCSAGHRRARRSDGHPGRRPSTHCKRVGIQAQRGRARD